MKTIDPKQETIDRLNNDNVDLIRKLIKTELALLNERRNNTCLRSLVERQAGNLISFKQIFGRLYWK